MDDLEILARACDGEAADAESKARRVEPTSRHSGFLEGWSKAMRKAALAARDLAVKRRVDRQQLAEQALVG